MAEHFETTQGERPWFEKSCANRGAANTYQQRPRVSYPGKQQGARKDCARKGLLHNPLEPRWTFAIQLGLVKPADPFQLTMLVTSHPKHKAQSGYKEESSRQYQDEAKDAHAPPMPIEACQARPHSSQHLLPLMLTLCFMSQDHEMQS